MYGQTLTLVAGIGVGVLGNLAYQWLQHAYDRFRDRPVKTRGHWGELMVGGGERRHSIGYIRYDLRRRMWTFNGTNYNNDGTPFCHWTTVASSLDHQNKRLYYIFLNTHVDHAHAGYTGFGFVDLELVQEVWRPRNGAFSAGTSDEGFRSHSMVPLPAKPSTRAEILQTFDLLIDTD